MQFDVCAIGNALVDVLAHGDYPLIEQLGLQPGIMQLVDRADSERIYHAMAPSTERSGGSAANTAAGIAALGGSASFIGRIGNDQFGAVFTHDLHALGVTFRNRPVSDAATGRSLVIVTPDAHRTMNTYLGAADQLSSDDLVPELIENAQITFMEGYLWDRPDAKDALMNAAHVARGTGNKVALTLSDPRCVQRHRPDFLRLISEEVDIVLANEHEAAELFEIEDFEKSVKLLREHCAIGAVTRSERGSIVFDSDTVHEIDAKAVPSLIDTTGAGDWYAAGFLLGVAKQWPIQQCGQLAAAAAGAVLVELGARVEDDLSQLVNELSAG